MSIFAVQAKIRSHIFQVMFPLLKRDLETLVQMFYSFYALTKACNNCLHVVQFVKNTIYARQYRYLLYKQN